MTKLPGETLHIQLLTPEREPKTGKSMDTNKIQLGKPMNFTAAEMTQTVIPPKPTPTWVTAHKSWESGRVWKSLFYR